MAILDDVIGVFSPGWKAARLRSRAVIQAYEAVKTTRTHKARRENRTADQLSQYGAVSLREQARYLDNNHDLVIGVFDKLEERVVGKNGIIVEPHPVLRNGAIARDLAAEIRTRWSEWSVSPEVTGQFTRPMLERLMLRTWLRDGEVFAEGLRHVPGDVIEICDDDYAGISIGGRVLAVNSQTRTLTLDREITLPSSGTTLINHTHSVTGASAVSQWSQNGSVHKVVSAASVNTSAAGAHTHSVSGTAASAGAHAHTVGIGAHTHSVAIGSHGHTITVNAAGNAENTVKNIAFNYIVRLA